MIFVEYIGYVLLYSVHTINEINGDISNYAVYENKHNICAHFIMFNGRRYMERIS